MESVRVTPSIVGTNAAEVPNVKFWKFLYEYDVSDFITDEHCRVQHLPASSSVSRDIGVSIHQRRY